MLKDGQKGVILQRDKESYAIAPNLPCGVLTPEILDTFSRVARKYDIPLIKITSATRIALMGIKENEVDPVWDELGFDQGHATGLCVRSVKVCPGTTSCRLAKQDSMHMGRKFDELYHGMKLPTKMKMAVSGCKISCAENCIKDISIYGTDTGWTVQVGGMGGIRPRLADTLIENVSTEEAERIVARLIDFCKENGSRARLGFTIDKIGFDEFQRQILK